MNAEFEEISRKIQPLLEKHGVETCYLFGSRAQGPTHPESDVNLAVVFPRSAPQKRDLGLLVRLEAELAGALAPLPVDLVFLQREGIAFRYEVISTGKVVYCRDDEARTDFEDEVVRDYLDFAPFLARSDRELMEDIRGGAFFAQPPVDPGPPRHAP